MLKSLIKKIFCILFLCNIHNAQAYEFQNYTFQSPDLAARYQTLIHEIRCPVCQNQSIADSNAPLAHDLREKIYHLLQAQQSDEAIKKYLVTRYGDFILLTPPFKTSTYLLWAFPFLALLLFSIFFIYEAQQRRLDSKR